MNILEQNGSRIYDCVPQSGPCPMKCNQCYFNRGYYRKTPFIDNVPDDAIVRMNCGHDSNIKRDLVIAAAVYYKNVFFNTSIELFDFPGPVVFTANPDEERPAALPTDTSNIMYVRLRVSSMNLELIDEAVKAWSPLVPVVLTFMAYYDYCPETGARDPNGNKVLGHGSKTKNYEWKVRHVNSYWCPTQEFIGYVKERYSKNPRVFVCGKWCRDCGLCERFYGEFMAR